jgi:uncharacterized RDD family membrane protein YckC
MEIQGSGDGLVVATPERVAFEYRVAGIGSRFLAQVIDTLIMAAALTAVGFVCVGIAASGNSQLALLVFVVFIFLLVFGYFALFEGIWSGQTVGKRALKLRVVGEHGEPVSTGQVLIRNFVRIVDFLPAWYGIGIVVLFANGRGKRLGDLAAGTLVVRDRDPVRLRDLARRAEAATVPAAPQERRSIWGQDRAPTPLPSTTAVPGHPCAAAARQLQPELRRFVRAYATRRAGLSWERRAWLADRVGDQLRTLLPRQVAADGTLAALECLAGAIFLEEGSVRP